MGWSIAALSALVSMQAAHGQAPRVDQTFAGAGVMTLPWTRSNLDRDAIAPAVDGGTFIAHEGEQDIRLIRLDERGNPVSSYVGAGIARLSIDEPLDLSAIHVRPDGSLLLGGRRDLIRVDPAGRIDRTFGDQGRTRIPYVTDGICATARIRTILPHAGGWIVVARRDFRQAPVPSLPTEYGCTLVARIESDGTPDLAFGTYGNVSRASFIVFDAVLRGDYLEMIGYYADRTGAWVERMALDGTMVGSFGVFGSQRLADNGPSPSMADGRILDDGSLAFIAASDQRNLALYRYRPDHAIDLSFAGLGRSVVPMRSQDPTMFDRHDPRILHAADGGFIVRTRVVDTSVAVQRTEDLYKFDARGAPDRTFGDSGYARHRTSGNFRIVAWAMRPDGYVVYTAATFQAPSSQPSGPTGMPGPPPTYVPVSAFATRVQAVPDIVEFHNAISRHYFVAYDGSEAQGIEAGAAGPGWSRTGLAFRPGGPSPACRFYTAGANSHFFTVEPEECEEVKRSPGWLYEGLGFYATRLASGACAPPLVPVNRFYNNRAHANDSNHRYVTDLSVAPAMLAQGWVLEGPVFCARP